MRLPSPVQLLTPSQAPDALRAQANVNEQAGTVEQRRVAREFEAIFLRQLMSGMEKSPGLGGTGTGAGVYRSMMVGALADGAAEGGGIGLAEMILKALLANESPAPEPAPHSGAAPGGTFRGTPGAVP